MKKRVRGFVVVGLAAILMCTGLVTLLFNRDKGSGFATAGTVENPFLIRTFADIDNSVTRRDMGAVRSGGYHFKLANDITFPTATWAPITLLASGNTFDGDGYIIRNMNLGGGTNAGGLFANLNGTVKNVEFSNVSASNGTLKGAVAGTVVGTTALAVVDAKIENVGVVAGSFTTNRIGGLVGAVGMSPSNGNGAQSSASQVKLTIDKCYNQASFTTNSNSQTAGGIVGLVYKATADISKTYNTGSIIVSNKGNAGGFIGSIESGSVVKIENCYNTGRVEGTSGQGYLGGFVGNVTGSTLNVTSCASSGEVVAGGGASIPSGIAPDVGGVTVEDSVYNSGTGAGTPADSVEVDDAIEDIIFIIEGGERSRHNITTPSAVEQVGYTFGTTNTTGVVYTRDSYEFWVDLAASHGNLVVKVNGEEVASSSQSGSRYSYFIERVDEDLDITVSVELNTYKMTIPSTLPTGIVSMQHVAGDTVDYGGSYSVAIELNPNYNFSAVQAVGATASTMTQTGSSGNVYTYRLANITEAKTITVTTTPKQYQVIRPTSSTGYTVSSSFAGTANVAYGSIYSFTVQLAEGYRATAPNFTGTTGATPVLDDQASDTAAGTYVYKFVVSGAANIQVSAKINEYTVTLPGSNFPTGVTAVAESAENPDPLKHGDLYKFVVTLDAAYNQVAPTVTISGVTVTASSVADNKVTYSFVATKNIDEITIQPRKNTYAVNDPIVPTGYIFERLTEAGSISHGNLYTFTLETEAAYSNATIGLSVTVGSKTLVLGDDLVFEDGEYSFAVTGAVSIVISPISKNDYTISVEDGNDACAVTGLPDKATHGEAFSFTVAISDNDYTLTSVTMKAGSQDVALSRVGNVYTVSDGSKIIDNITITIETSIKAFTITRTSETNNGFVYENTTQGITDSIDSGAAYTFKVKRLGSHSQRELQVVVTMGGATQTPSEIGTGGSSYTYSIAAVTGNIVVTVTPMSVNEYTITNPSQEGYIFTRVTQAGVASAITLAHGSEYVFSLAKQTAYTQATVGVSVVVGGETLVLGDDLILDDGKYSFSVTGAVTITLTPISKNSYEVTLGTDAGVDTVAGVDDGDFVTHSESVVFTVAKKAAYSGSEIVVRYTYDGESFTTVTPNGSGVYTISSITGEITISVSVPNINTYSITPPTTANGFSFAGKIGGEDFQTGDLADYGDTVWFKVTRSAAYSNSPLNVTVRMGDVVQTNGGKVAISNDAGVYTITITGVTGNISITVGTLTINKYNVTIVTQDGYSFSGIAAGENDHGNYTLNVAPDNSDGRYSADKFEIIINDGNSDIKTITTAGNHAFLLDRDITITFTELDVNTYTVKGLGTESEYTVAAYMGASDTVTHGDSFSFTVTLAEAYTQMLGKGAFVYYTIGADATKNPLTPVGGIYTIINITDDVEIGIGTDENPLVLNQYTITKIDPLGGYAPVQLFDEMNELYTNETVEHGTKLYVKVLIDSSYYGITVEINGETDEWLTGVDGFEYVSALISVNSDLTIRVRERTANMFTVILPFGNGLSHNLVGNTHEIVSGSLFEFTMTLDASYNQSENDIMFMFNQWKYTDLISLGAIQYNKVNLTYQFRINSVNQNFVITALDNRTNAPLTINSYTIADPNENTTGYNFDRITSDGRINHGSTYTFTLTREAGYYREDGQYVVITVGGQVITPTVVGNTYSFPVTGETAITLKQLQKYVYNVTHVSGAFTLKTEADVTMTMPSTVEYGDDIKFKVVKNASHSNSEVVVRYRYVSGGYVVVSPVLGVYTVPNITGHITIEVSVPTINMYTITAPTGDGFSFSGNTETAPHGTQRTFVITLDSGYSKDTLLDKISFAMVNGTLNTDFEVKEYIQGRYEVKIYNMTGNIVFAVDELEINTYTVNVTSPSESESFTTTPSTISSSITHGESIKFRVTKAVSHSGSSVTVKYKYSTGNEITVTPIGGEYTIPNIAGNVTIIIEVPTRNVYTITRTSATGNGFAYAPSMDLNVAHGSNYAVSITRLEEYNKTPMVVVVKMAGAPDTGNGVGVVASQTIAVGAGGVFTHTISNVIGNIEIIVEPMPINRYNVTIEPREGYSITGIAEGARTHGSYTISVTFSDDAKFSNAYPNGFKVYVGTAQPVTLTATADPNVWTYTWTLDKDTTIKFAELPVNEYTIADLSIDAPVYYGFTRLTKPGEGVSITLKHGEIYSFRVTKDSAYNPAGWSVEIEIDDVVVPVTPVGSNYVETYSFAVTSSNIKISFGQPLQKYSYQVTVSADSGVQSVTDMAGTSLNGVPRNHGEAFTFKVNTKASHNKVAPTVAMTVGGITVNLTKKNNEYTVAEPAKVTGAITITVTTVLNNYSVTLTNQPSNSAGWMFEGNLEDIADGSVYSFRIYQLASHNQEHLALFVMVFGDNAISYKEGVQDGMKYFEYTVAKVIGDIEICVNPMEINTYTVALPELSGFKIHGAFPSSVKHGNDFKFQIQLLESHSDTAPYLVIGNNEYEATLKDAGNRIYEFVIPCVESNIKNLSVVATVNTYSIDLVGDTTSHAYAPLGRYTISGDAAAQHGEDYKFTVTMVAAYNKTFVVMVNDVEDTGIWDTVVKNGNAFTFTLKIAGVTEIEIVPTLNTYEVTIDGEGIQPDAVGPYTHGTSPLFTITPAEGMMLKSIVVDGKEQLLDALIFGEYSYTINGITANMTLSVEFEAIWTYSLTFVSNENETGFSLPPFANIRINEPLYLDQIVYDEVLVRVGYKFTGWYSRATGGTLMFPAGQKEFLYKLGMNNNMVLYARWTPIEYNIEFHGAEMYSESNIVTRGQTYSNTIYSTSTNIENGVWQVWTGGDKANNENWDTFSATKFQNIAELMTPAFVEEYAKEISNKMVFTFRYVEAEDTWIVHADTIDTRYGEMYMKINGVKSESFKQGDEKKTPFAPDVKIAIESNLHYEIVSVTVKIDDGNTETIDVNDVYWELTLKNTESTYEIGVMFRAIDYTLALNTYTSAEVINWTQTNNNSIPGAFTETEAIVSIENNIYVLRAAAVTGYSFDGFFIINQLTGNPTAIIHSNGFAPLFINEEFLNIYLADRSTTIVIVAVYTLKSKFKVEFANASDVLGGEFSVEYKGPSDSEFQTVRNSKSEQLFELGTEILITIETNPNFSLGSVVLMTYAGEAVPGLAINDNQYSFTLYGNWKLKIEFVSNSYQLVIKTVDVTGSVFKTESRTVVYNQSVNISVDGVNRYAFTRWYFEQGAFDFTDYLAANNSLSQLIITRDIINRLRNDDNAIVLCAEFAEKMVLEVSIHNPNRGANGFALSIGDGEFKDFFTSINEGHEINETLTSTLIKIKPIVAKHFELVGFYSSGQQVALVDGMLTFTLNSWTDLRLEYAPVFYSIDLAEQIGSNGSFEFKVNGVEVTGETKIKIGDTLTVTFNTNSGYQLTNMEINGTSGTKSSVTFTLTESVLTGLLNGEDVLELSVEAESRLDPAIFIGIGIAAVAAVLAAAASIYFIISMKKKKAEYALAVERQKQAKARMQASSSISDVLKKARGE